MGSGDHKDNLLFFIDFIEETPGSNSISPSFGIEALEFFDIRSKMGMLTKLRIYETMNFVGNFAMAGFSNVIKIFLKLFSFENPIFIQRSALFVT